MANKDIFYLESVFPEADKVFSSNYPTIEEIKKKCIFILDTNILFVPFDTSEKSLAVIGEIFKQLKVDSRLFLPARVAREFAKNRGKTIGDVFLKIRQKKNGLNSGGFKIDDYPILEHNDDFIKLKENFSAIRKLISESRELFSNIENYILSWNWNDPVSNTYKEIFTPDIVIEMKKSQEDLEKDLKFRIEHKIPPGFKDSGKIDDGVGDLIVWQTVLEIGKDKNMNVILVSNDQKNDWYYIQDKTGLYPRFELFDEFRRFTNGNSIAMINFPQLLKMYNASEDIVDEVENSIRELQEHKQNISEILWLRRNIEIEMRSIVQSYLSDEQKDRFEKRFMNISIMINIMKENDLFSQHFLRELMSFYQVASRAAHEVVNLEPQYIEMGKIILRTLKENNK
ncbi:PIN domain-containing protein [Bernardetia sp. Wsw4-3y2]|uniref:PIN-like domain-containing protein n=1 Tax=Bernardetia sp. Wsw4-3y2 TaxID=3127471 RepID=UPI0030D0A1A5